MIRDVGNMLRMLKNTKEITRGCWAMSGKLQKTFRNFFGGDNERCQDNTKQCQGNVRGHQTTLKKLQKMSNKLKNISRDAKQLLKKKDDEDNKKTLEKC